MAQPVYASILALIANPSEFDGKHVRVVGYVVSQLELWAVFNSEIDCRHGVTKNAIWLDTYNTPYAEISDAYAVVEGKFDAKSCGHLGMWSGTIRSISRLAPWAPRTETFSSESMQLDQLFLAWSEWAKTADQSENGWQSDFPAWSELVDAAWAAQCSEGDAERLTTVEHVWAISAESEEMLARQQDAWNRLRSLAESPFADCRWQIYETASGMAARANSLLRKGLGDADSYARRRAILGLARLRPPDARELSVPLLADADPYARQAAIELVLASDDEAFIEASLQTLAVDPIDHVRGAAVAAMTRRGTK